MRKSGSNPLELKCALYLAALSFLLVGCSVKIRGVLNINGASSASSTPVVLPAGAVIPFDLAACPTGWTAFTSARGKFLVGSGTGNGNVDSLGGALTARTAGWDGGREFTTGVPADTGAANAFSATSLNVPSASFSFTTLAAADTTLGGAKADSNMPPFIARLYCKKNADDTTIPASTLISYPSAACPSSWSEDTAVRGRAVVGVGVGNTDEDATPLTARALGDTGGREYTTGIPANSGAAGAQGPGPNAVITVSATALSYFNSSTATDSLGGTSTDSNLPPYLALLSCKAPTVLNGLISSGTVIPFDLPSCPSGWSAYGPSQGRVLFGAGNTVNFDADLAPLTSRSIGETGGLEYTTGIPSINSSIGETAAIGPAVVFGVISGRTPPDMYALGSGDTTFGGAKADSNMPPYVAILYCQKD